MITILFVCTYNSVFKLNNSSGLQSHKIRGDMKELKKIHRKVEMCLIQSLTLGVSIYGASMVLASSRYSENSLLAMIATYVFVISSLLSN